MSTRARHHLRRVVRLPAGLATLLIISASALAQSGGAIAKSLGEAIGAAPAGDGEASAVVLDLESGSVVFERAGDRPLIPASTMKVVAMAVALNELGPDFRFRTVLATDGANLMIIGDGDPALGDQKVEKRYGREVMSVLREWALLPATAGVDDFPGSIIVDDTIFESTMLHPSWEPNDLNKWYAAPVCGVNFNGNCIDIVAIPVPGERATARVEYTPPATTVQIENELRFGRRGSPVLRHRYDARIYQVRGYITERWAFPPVSYPDPAELTASAFRSALSDVGVALQGDFQRRRLRDLEGDIPRWMRKLDVHETAIADVLRRAGKDSQNLFAECLLKRAGYAFERRSGKSDAVGSWASGAVAAAAMFDAAGISRTGLVVADGSGLSRENRASARQLVGLLAWSNEQPWGDMFRASLSIAGVDGSLDDQLADVPARVYAKTGTMRGVRALAGYVVGESDSPRYAFAILFNGYRGASTPYRAIQDDMCRILVAAAAGG